MEDTPRLYGANSLPSLSERVWKVEKKRGSFDRQPPKRESRKKNRVKIRDGPESPEDSEYMVDEALAGTESVDGDVPDKDPNGSLVYGSFGKRKQTTPKIDLVI
jgi:hypothetical protein